MNDQSYEILCRLSRRDLLLFANSKNIDIPDSYSKEQIIAILLETIPGELNDQVRNTVRLELRATETNLRSVLGDTTSEIKNDIAEFSEKLIGVNMIKWLYGSIGTIMAVILSVVTFFGYSGLTDLQKNVNQINTLKESLKITTQTYSDYLVDRVVKDIKIFMDEFNCDLPKGDRFEKIVKYQNSLQSLKNIFEELDEKKIIEESESYRKIGLVHDFLINLNKVKKLSNFVGIDSKNVEFNKVINKITEYKINNDIDDKVMVKQFESYYENILGVLYFNLFLVTEKGLRSHKDLDKAKQHFSNAMEKDNTYARVYHNRIAVCYMEYASPKINKDRKIEIIKYGKEIMTRTDKCPQTPYDKSTMYNNLAALYLVEAELYEKINISSAKAALKQAHKNALRALETKDVHPGAYFSLAEIESYYIHLFQTYSAMNQVKKESRVNEISDLIRLSFVNGFSLDHSLKKEAFFGKYYFLNHLQDLKVPYKDQIFEAVHL